MPFEKVALVPVWAEVPHLFPENYRAALAWAEEVTLVSETHASDEAYAAVSAVFAAKDLVDLTITIAAMNAFNRLGAPFPPPGPGEGLVGSALRQGGASAVPSRGCQSIPGGSSTSHVADFFRGMSHRAHPARHFSDGRLKAARSHSIRSRTRRRVP